MRTRKHESSNLDKPVRSTTPTGDRRNALHEAYKKHATELASIEDRLNKFLLVILAVFGAGATAVTKIHLADGPALVLAFVVAVITLFSLHYNNEIHDLRHAVRDLLVRCEMSMEFYDKDVFLVDNMLYTLAELDYPKKGAFLRLTSMTCIVAAGVGLIVLMYTAPCATGS